MNPVISHRVTTAPAAELVTLIQAKAHCRITTTDEDTLVTSLLTAARAHLEHECRRAFINQTVTLTADAFPRLACRGRWAWEWDGDRLYPDDAMRLPWGRVQSVTSVSYVDANGVSQTMDAAAYHVDTASEPCRVTPAYGTCWPITRCQTGAVTVVYVAGYGATAASVPVPIYQAALLLINHFFVERQPINVGNITTPLDYTIEALIGPHKVY